MYFDTSYWLEVTGLVLRWLHLIVGIAWIGSSFYFIWLDNSIREPKDPDLKNKGVLGELWAMHAGGFYNPQKYVVAPKVLPEKLHWFFWPSYTTFITGFLLITALYYMQASVYMIDKNRHDLTPFMAVHIGIATLVVGFIVYDLLCRLLFEKSLIAFALIYTIFVAGVSFALNQVLSGRAAFIHVGAMIATTMTANVFFIIIPAQRKIVGAMKRGEQPDAKPGKRAKQRSVHNNYLTLPVLFSMISNHYAFIYDRKDGWWLLMVIMIGSVFIRHFFNLRHKEITRWRYPIIGCAMIGAVFVYTSPRSGDQDISIELGRPVSLSKEIVPIIQQRCVACHAVKPTVALPGPPKGLVLEDVDQIVSNANKIYQQVVVEKKMPSGNLTDMDEKERRMIASWFRNGAVKD